MIGNEDKCSADTNHTGTGTKKFLCNLKVFACRSSKRTEVGEL
jgi:hypothetical protein